MTLCCSQEKAQTPLATFVQPHHAFLTFRSMLPQALPIFQAFCETSLAFDFLFRPPYILLHFQDERDSCSPLCLCSGCSPGLKYPYLLPSKIQPILWTQIKLSLLHEALHDGTAYRPRESSSFLCSSHFSLHLLQAQVVPGGHVIISLA